jgi:hypothetical protein
MMQEVARWKNKFLLLSCNPWKPHSILASSPNPQPGLWSKEVTWWRKKFLLVGL